MSPKKSTSSCSNIRKPKAVWNFKEEKLLIEFLTEHITEAGDGFHFKKTMFQAASNLLEPRHSEGRAKNWSSCKTKWQTVCGRLLSGSKIH
jgi:hypothetical protein